MERLGEQLDRLGGRIRLLCIGNSEGGDDAFGIRLGEELLRRGRADVVLAGTDPESALAHGAAMGCDHLIFVDAVDFAGPPGSVVLLDCDEIAAKYPQVSTHRLSLGLLARWVESSSSDTRAWLLGVQPETLGRGQELSPCVQAAMEAISNLLIRRLGAGATVC